MSAGAVIGSQASLRWMCPQGRGGSSPLPRTFLEKKSLIIYHLFYNNCKWKISRFSIIIFYQNIYETP